MDTMDINDTIFNMVKTNLTNDVNPEIFLKLCSGTATDLEKEESGLSQEVIEKLKVCCNTGYNIASSLDGNDLKNEILNLKNEILELKSEILNLKSEMFSLTQDVSEICKFI